MSDEILLPLLFGRGGGNGGRDDGGESSSEDEENDDDEEEEEEEEVENIGEETEDGSLDDMPYDASLPAQHTYLGDDLEELRGRTVLEDDHMVRLPLVVLPNVVLMPGQKLPLQLLHPATVSMMQHIIDNDRTFGLINQRQMEPGHTLPTKKAGGGIVGTTAEVRSYKEDSDEGTGFTLLRVLAEGSQRFRIQEHWRQPDGILMGKVSILPEVTVGDILEGARLPSLQRFLDTPPNFDRLTLEMIGCEGGQYALREKPSRKKYDRWACSTFTRWPSWVYKQYDTESIVRNLKQEIASWNSHLKLDTSPKDPNKFSYWVGANIPIDDRLKLDLLSLDSAIQRLRSELWILKRYIVLRCKACGDLIAEKKDVFSMSVEGPQGTYVNPGGYVHDTITVYRATGLDLVGRPSTQHSWFPGYAWIIAECRHCSIHAGWKFVATSKKLKPETFWGLCRSSVVSGTKATTDEEGGGDSKTATWIPCM